MAATCLAVLGLALAGGAVFLPYWVSVPAQADLGWGPRNVGLFKVSGQFTDLQTTPADISWSLTGSATASGVLGSLMMSRVFDVSCKEACKSNMFARCSAYGTMVYIGFIVAALLVLGCLVVAVGASMPYFSGKEKKGGKLTNLIIIAVGATVSAVAPLTFFFWTETMRKRVSASSWYPEMPLGMSFYLAVGAVVSALLAVIPQTMKVVMVGREKKVEEAAAGLTSALDPALVDPALL
jgi:hypothetical protein